MAGLTIWWDRPLVGYPRIHVEDIEDRKTTTALSTTKKITMDNVDNSNYNHHHNNISNNETTTTTTTSMYEDGKMNNEDGGGAFRKAWEEAHNAFRTKAQTREKQVIHM